MRLIVSEKNIAARRIAEILAKGTATEDKVYSVPVYRFERDGEDWVSIGLKGHIMEVDFPEEFAKWCDSDLVALVDAEIRKVPKEKGIIRSVKSLAKKADEVVIATDYDREGELIGSDARTVVHAAAPGLPVARARFSALTSGEVERAFAELEELSDDLASAGEARQDIDLVWGAVLTRYLTCTSNAASNLKWGAVFSAGRVQTPTLRLVIERERARDAFVPETYWTIAARMESDEHEFTARHQEERFSDEAAAGRAMAAVEGQTKGTVQEVKKTERKVKPPAPFNTTSLMAAASSQGFTPAQTMRVAETLYMNGFVSYPRVDNTVYPASLDLRDIVGMLSASQEYAGAAGDLLSKASLTPTRGKKQSTDHPPIHPTGLPDRGSMQPREWKLYDLIARRFLATLSDAALVENTRVSIVVGGEPFVAKGDVLVFSGFRAVYPYGLKKEERLPALRESQEVAFLGAELEEKETQPPSRFGQGKLIQEMEQRGLGTKATRHNTIQTLYDREYVVNDPMEPTCRGISVVEALEEYAPRITLPEMTGELESDMDAIAEARAARDDVVDHSRELLREVMEVLVERTEGVGMLLKKATDEDAKIGVCPTSGDDLRVKYSPKNKTHFVGCAGYPECDVTYPLPQAARYESVDGPCGECGTPRVRLIQFRQKPREVCLNPDCPTRQEPPVVIGACPTGDGGELVVRRSPSTLKRFVRCTGYDECGTSYPLPQWGDIEPTGEVCEPCGTPKVVVQTRRGPWKICVDPDCSTKNKGRKKGSESSSKKGSSGKTGKGKKGTGKKAAEGSRDRSGKS